jgi:hypothetical protein
MDAVFAIVDKVLPGFLRAHGAWQLVSGVLLGWSVKNTVDKWKVGRATAPCWPPIL